jgi:hypothetical protein
MRELKVQTSCEIDDLISVLAERLSKTYDDVESQAEAEGLLPQGSKTYVDVRWPKPSDGWFCKEVQKLLGELGIQGIYITNGI